VLELEQFCVPEYIMVGCEFLIVCIQLHILAELFNNNFCVLEISFMSPGTQCRFEKGELKSLRLLKSKSCNWFQAICLYSRKPVLLLLVNICPLSCIHVISVKCGLMLFVSIILCGVCSIMICRCNDYNQMKVNGL
jgi:hypothetical protein